MKLNERDALMEQTRPRVMITGAAGNLGRAAAEAFARRGARLVLLDIDLERLKVAYRGEATDRSLLAVDLTDEASVAKILVPALEPLGPISVLCNIAGGFLYGEPVHRMPLADWNRLHAMNAGTMLNAVRSAVPGMIEAGEGTVINIGAAGHVHGHANMGAYAASKGEVMRLTESMAEELQGTGVSVFCLMPNIIDTPQNRAEMPSADHSSWTPPADIAELMWLLTNEAASLISGCLIPLRGRRLRAPRD